MIKGLKILLLLLFCNYSKAYSQHKALANAFHNVKVLQQEQPGFINDSSYLQSYTDLIYFLCHFRDTTTLHYIQQFEKETKASKLPTAKGYWLLGQSLYMHFIKKNYKTALNSALEAIGIFEKENYLQAAALCHNRASAILLWQSVLESNNIKSTCIEAIQHSEKARQLAQRIKDTNIICTSLMYAANNYLNLENTDSAKLLLKEAEELALSCKLAYPVDNNIWGTTAELYTFLEQPKLVFYYADKCLQSGIEQKDLYCISNIWQMKGELLSIHGKNKNLQLAATYLDSAYKYASIQNDISLMCKIEKSLFETFRAAKNSDKALKYLELYTQHNDAIRKQSETSIKTDYTLAEREKEISVLENKNLISNSKKQKLLIWILSLLGLIVALVAAFYARNNYLLRQKKKEIEAAQKKGQTIERKRMSSDLHDNLGVQASAILHSATLLKENSIQSEEVVESLHDTAKEMLTNLRETLWAMRQSEVLAEELWIRVINFSKQIGKHYKVPKIQMEGNLPNAFMLDSPKALHLLMIIQEVINNAVKHAGATLVTVKSEPIENEWHILIEDNGVGFIVKDAKSKNESYGLNNIIERASDAKVEISIQSSIGNGTKITINV